MFTGIIQAVGSLRGVERRGASAWLSVGCPFAKLELGESVAVDGVCLTVVRVIDGGFTADASAETLARTTLGERAVGARVNLERALALGDRMGGHIVAGHVDGVGELARRERVESSERVTFRAPREVLRYVAEKGSVAIDGVSLTVNAVSAEGFEVMLVPFTQGATTLSERRAGDRVNLEVDVIARYVARALTWEREAPDPGAAAAGTDARWRALLDGFAKGQ
ncbi:MAG: riboflavin synthase [Deltaproteobacteria bacterium]|nr:riboflavin synthase [Myxococcales bacterium]MDP3212619.1 riboflavin synthase [Deltaproteobacteria bacterium]